MGKLTDVQLRHWIKAGAPVAKSDGDGLTFTLSAKGTAAWVLRYCFGGKQKEITLGRYPDITLTKARELALAQRFDVQRGKDVAMEKRKQRIQSAGAQLFRQLAADYMAKKLPGLAANTAQHRRRHIEKHILPKLGAIPAREVETADIVAVIEAVGGHSVNVADLVFTALKEIFKHGLACHVVTANPCAGVTVAAIAGKADSKRDRLKLTDEELRAILPALPGIGEQNALAVKILLATCARIGELTQAEWAHVDFDRAEWFMPVENIKTGGKTGKGFTVPLAPCVLAWFQTLKALACGSPYVLPARTLKREKRLGGDAPMEQRTLNRQLGLLSDRLGDKVRRFTPHDLRSTARSHLAELGVSPVLAERCLNHTLGGLVAVYDQHDYLTERRAALELWARKIQMLEAGEDWNIVPLRKSAS